MTTPGARKPVLVTGMSLLTIGLFYTVTTYLMVEGQGAAGRHRQRPQPVGEVRDRIRMPQVKQSQSERNEQRGLEVFEGGDQRQRARAVQLWSMHARTIPEARRAATQRRPYGLPSAPAEFGSG